MCRTNRSFISASVLAISASAVSKRSRHSRRFDFARLQVRFLVVETLEGCYLPFVLRTVGSEIDADVLTVGPYPTFREQRLFAQPFVQRKSAVRFLPARKPWDGAVLTGPAPGQRSNKCLPSVSTPMRNIRPTVRACAR